MSCDGSGILDCYCGGDHCACGCPPACPGCVECAPEPDPEVRVAQLEAELESVRGLDLPALMTLTCFYDSQLACFQPIRADTESLDTQDTRLEHVRWMLSEMLNMTDAGKLNRWLGFVQGALWCSRVFTVDELRTHVREVSR